MSDGINKTTPPIEALTPGMSPAAISGQRPGAPHGADFSQVLAGARQTAPATSAKPPANRWSSLSFLASETATRRSSWPWTYSDLNRLLETTNATNAALPVTETAAPTAITQPSDAFLYPSQPLTLADYPRPTGDNGMGIHWIPTVRQTPEVVDKFVAEAADMGMKWVLFLNEGTNTTDNDYLVEQLTEAGIEPMMRIYTPGLQPIEGDLQGMVEHYTDLGVRYFQLYNEPNLMVETDGQFPDVDHYLDLWVPAAKAVIAGGGLPGLGALSPQGEMDDRQYLRDSLVGLQARGELGLLNRSWLAMHNYTGPRAMDDPDGFKRFQQYDQIIRGAIGRSIPIIGTEGGTHITEHVSEAQQVAMVTDAYRYMREQREPYNFAYTYWIIANGHDSAWDEHALIRSDGPTALAQALKQEAANRRQAHR